MTAGTVVTVRGPVEPSALGVTLPHEHLFLNLENWWVEPGTEADREFARKPVTLGLLSSLRYRAMSNWDNIHIDDEETVLREVGAFSDAGGGTIVDVTLRGIGRDPARLRRVSEAANVHVVCGCGYYVQSAHPPEVEEMTSERLADAMVEELIDGIDGSGIRAGVIGEIGRASCRERV